jgi:hypothetical protein
MSEGNGKVEPMIIKNEFRECPRHEGNFDCTPFCDVCEGRQEFEWFPEMPCRYCDTPVDTDVWFEEMEMCVDCSNKYYDGELDD